MLGLLAASPANVGVENPALQQFLAQLPPVADGPAPASGLGPLGFMAATPLGGVQISTGALLAAFIPSLLIVVGLMVRRRFAPARMRRRLEIAAVPFCVTAALSFALLIPKMGSPTAVDLTTGSALMGTPTSSAEQAGRIIPVTGSLWQRLNDIELTVAQLEAQLQAVNMSAAAAGMSPNDPTLHPARAAQLTSTTGPTASQQAITTQLGNALQTEYGLYVTAAKNPAQQQALLSAAQNASPDAGSAVIYNLQLVETQLAQEAAIQAAEQSAISGTGSAPTTLRAPEVGPITQGFGPSSFGMEPAFTFDGVFYRHFHTGLDIAGVFDNAIQAAAAGVVMIAGASTDVQGNLVGYGNYVVIAHAGRMITLYGHLDRILVHAGQAVQAGDVIGLEGSSGNSTGPHLHFEVRVAGLLADPMRYLGAQFQGY
ncbi:MAG: hypothetical protein NVS3B18_15380 [Candidatus Dormibacteria bacterium]